MQNDDVVKILNDLRDAMDENRNVLEFEAAGLYIDGYNDGITVSMEILEELIKRLSLTPNQLKQQMGLYYN
jgi:hypothetical protein